MVTATEGAAATEGVAATEWVAATEGATATEGAVATDCFGDDSIHVAIATSPPRGESVVGLAGMATEGLPAMAGAALVSLDATDLVGDAVGDAARISLALGSAAASRTSAAATDLLGGDPSLVRPFVLLAGLVAFFTSFLALSGGESDRV